jgi:dipeptidyl aminopeptidase/acylaminoacyl peptidase
MPKSNLTFDLIHTTSKLFLVCGLSAFWLIAQAAETGLATESGGVAPKPHFFSTASSVQSQEDCQRFFEKKFATSEPAGAANVSAESRAFQQAQKSFGEQLRKVDCFRFVYKVAAHWVEGYVLQPKTEAKSELKKLPAIIYNRGGNDTASFIGPAAVMMNYSFLAHKGFVVIASQYRGAKVWPADTPFNIGQDEYGGKDVDDVLALLPILEGMPNVDSQRIGMMGVSRGGMMTYLAAKNNPKIKAISVVSGFADLLDDARRRPELEKGVLARLIPDYQTNKEAALKARSVVYWPEQLDKKMPVFLIHGGEDARVAVENTVKLAELLKQRNHPHKLLLYPKAGHDLAPHWYAARNEIVSWFSEKL